MYRASKEPHEMYTAIDIHTALDVYLNRHDVPPNVFRHAKVSSFDHDMRDEAIPDPPSLPCEAPQDQLPVPSLPPLQVVKRAPIHLLLKLVQD
jgi:hypothetical protein